MCNQVRNSDIASKLSWHKAVIVIAAVATVVISLVLGGNYLVSERSERTRLALIATLEGKTPPTPINVWDQRGFIARCKNKTVSLRTAFTSLAYHKYDYSGTCGTDVQVEIDCKVTSSASCATSDTYESHMRRMQEVIEQEKIGSAKKAPAPN